jgi:hypothetical protein
MGKRQRVVDVRARPCILSSLIAVLVRREEIAAKSLV